MSKLRTVLELLNLGSGYLEQQGCPTPRLDAEVLLCHVLNMDRVQLYVNFDRPLEVSEIDQYRYLIGWRGRRVPVSYLLGKREFYSKEFKVTRDVLIPRPETEILVEQAIKLVQPFIMPRVIDLGTGSGVIAVSLALQISEIQVLAADISSQALAVAQENATLLGVEEKITFLQSDLFQKIPNDKYHLICSNPPYIPTKDLSTLEPEVRLEPKIALDGGIDGLDFYRRIIAQAPEYLISGGHLVLEIGWDQGAKVIELGRTAGFVNCQIIPDYAGKDRVVTLTWK
ncbi:MAG: peptide chain release factor N(5)-glutamine methyltransferase [Firmicutes bacterium]|nr:peptide chain release factor N(5)-glutamine methyltransferase [Bacillota bacterium]